MKNIIFSVCISLLCLSANAQQNFWHSATHQQLSEYEAQRKIFPSEYQAFSLDVAAFKKLLFSAPMEFSAAAKTPVIITLPMPSGKFERFAIVETQVQAPGTPEIFADIKTFSGNGIDNPAATIRLDWTFFGFHAMIQSGGEVILIDPYAHGNINYYLSYTRKGFLNQFKEDGVLGIDESIVQESPKTAATCTGTQLRTYRLAVACTGEYAAAVGATNAQALHSAIVTTVNRVNGIFENELAIRLQLIPNNNLIEFLNAATDPFTGNNSAPTLINESQSVITSYIGSANYDIGHTFSTGAGGLAQLSSVCKASNKARGVTGLSYPVGDVFSVDYVSHEIGHQFGAEHSFNGTTGSCSGNRNASTAVEPGSGITIMGYAGNCGVSNLSNNSIPHFHPTSYDQIIQYATGSGACAVITNTNNAVPVVNAGLDYIIPKGTPFKLTGSATDADSPLLTYSWEENDVALTSGNWNSGSVPFFLSLPPTTDNFRYFPRLSSVVSGTTMVGEMLPQSPQLLNFRLTVRDNNPGGGATCNDQMVLTIDNSGPFQITSQSTDTAWIANGSNTVTIKWDVAGTNLPPVSCANVDILFSSDGGASFPYVLKANTPNDGSETVLIPSIKTTNGKIMIRSVNNIFYNVNNGNLSVSTAGCNAEGAEIFPRESVMDYAGSPSLNLSFNPVYGSFGASGQIITSDPTMNFSSKNASNICVNYSNYFSYHLYKVRATVSGTYTFSMNSTATIVNVYQASFSPSQPCASFINSSSSVNASNSLSNSSSVTVTLTAGQEYNVVIGVLSNSSSAPSTSLPVSYTLGVSNTPAGGVIYSGNGYYVNPGSGYSYGYLIVRSSDGMVRSFSSGADLSNATSYPAGKYLVYGVSYLSSAFSSIKAYEGQTFAALNNALVSGSVCANLSKNAIDITIQSPLPVVFMPLSATLDNKDAVLSWTTSMEWNTAYFEIEHSTNNKDFSVVGKQTSKGNSMEAVAYKFVHTTPVMGENFYRIKAVDVDGKFSFSNIALVRVQNRIISSVLVYPNPVADVLAIELFSDARKHISLMVTDAKGSVILNDRQTVQQGKNKLQLNVGHLPSGVYYLQTDDGNSGPQHQKFIKK